MAIAYATSLAVSTQSLLARSREVLCASCQIVKPAADCNLVPWARYGLKWLCHECSSVPVVYFLQLRQTANVLKIGSAMQFAFRLKDLRQEYGFFRVLALIPARPPRKLERTFHAQFQLYRLKHGSHREVFQFNSREGQSAIACLLLQYASCVRALPHWTSSPRLLPTSQLALL